MKFKIGYDIICSCGNCDMITISEITVRDIIGYTKDGREVHYNIKDDEERLRKISKLERALK